MTMDPRTRALLEAPIAPTLLRLAVPNMLVLVAQAAAGLIETYFIGKLGTDALAGVAAYAPLGSEGASPDAGWRLHHPECVHRRQQRVLIE